MEILAHRGYWTNAAEKNTPEALIKALQLGFGLETDIRNNNSELIIAHDIDDPSTYTCEHFFDDYCKHGKGLPLALNIKADGLQNELNRLLTKYGITNYFFFDMSAPQMLTYSRLKLSYFTRISEIEPAPILYAESNGVWLDQFNGEWITINDIKKHLLENKKVCIVSPELHRRPHETQWKHLKTGFEELKNDNVLLCTDFPTEAQKYFYGH